VPDKDFHYNTRGSMWGAFTLAMMFFVIGAGLNLIGGFFELPAQIFLGLSMFLGLVFLIYLLAPRTKYVRVTSDNLKVFFGLPWSQRSLTIPLSSIIDSEICKSPFHYIVWGKISGPFKYDEEQDVIRLYLSPSLQPERVEKIQRIKKNPLPVFYFAVNDDGTEFYIKASPKEGLDNLLQTIKESVNDSGQPLQENMAV